MVSLSTRGMINTDMPKAERVLAGAVQVFTRYGYARTTMADIAASAGISRPALYLLHKDKDAIFDAVIHQLDKHKLADIADALASIGDMGDKLRRACIDWGTHGVELAAIHPDAADLFDLRFAAVRQAYGNFEDLVSALIAEEVERSGIAATPAELARTLVYGMRGLRDAATDLAAFRRLIAIQVEILLRAIDAPGSGGTIPMTDPHAA